MSNTNGIISLIFGIFSLCCGWLVGAFLPIPFIGYIFPAVAIIFGIIGIIKDDSHGMAIAGLILGIISLICVFLVAALFLALILAMMGMGALP